MRLTNKHSKRNTIELKLNGMRIIRQNLTEKSKSLKPESRNSDWKKRKSIDKIRRLIIN